MHFDMKVDLGTWKGAAQLGLGFQSVPLIVRVPQVVKVKHYQSEHVISQVLSSFP